VYQHLAYCILIHRTLCFHCGIIWCVVWGVPVNQGCSLLSICIFWWSSTSCYVWLLLHSDLSNCGGTVLCVMLYLAWEYPIFLLFPDCGLICDTLIYARRRKAMKKVDEVPISWLAGTSQGCTAPVPENVPSLMDVNFLHYEVFRVISIWLHLEYFVYTFLCRIVFVKGHIF
jgi:hypothetical protein